MPRYFSAPEVEDIEMNQKPSQKLLFWTTAAAAFLEPEQTLLNRPSQALSVSSGIWGQDFVPELH